MYVTYLVVIVDTFDAGNVSHVDLAIFSVPV